MKVMIAAGGTGGHIYPALALADTLKEKDPSADIVFYGSKERMESTVIPEHGYRFIGMHIETTQGGIPQKVKSLLSLEKAQRDTVKLLKKEKPDICIGFGNYISVPLIKAAHTLHIPSLLHEANSYAGKATKYLAKYATGAVTCYESNASQLSGCEIRMLGNPEATIAGKVLYDPLELEGYGLDPQFPFVFFMMGSLGSSSVSKVIDEALPLLNTDYQVLIAEGKSNEYTFQYKSDERVKIVPYVNGKNMLKGCSLAVLRAGATTIAEIGAIGTASILIPSPYVPNNHQYWNAYAMVEKNAAEMIEEKDLNAKDLAQRINALMKNKKQLETMQKNAYAAGKRDAAEKMIEWMEEIVHD